MNKLKSFWGIFHGYTAYHCLKTVQKMNKWIYFNDIIKELNIDLFSQYTNDAASHLDENLKLYYITNVTNMHAFQVEFTKDCMESLVRDGLIKYDAPLVLVDIGDSAGTHLRYLKRILGNTFKSFHGVSVNLDPVAVEKINRMGGEAVLCRGEDYKPDNMDVSCYLSFEMVEHLHNPALFFYRIAKNNNGKYMVVTVPYRKKSRVAVRSSLNYKSFDKIPSELEHIFELSPDDWKKLAWHGGWKVRKEKIYYQYPRCSILAPIYKRAWEMFDFEGFYGMFLERDMSAAEKYTDWED